MQGESLYMTIRLLGHRRATTINHCAHIDGATLNRAAGREAVAIKRKLRVTQWLPTGSVPGILDTTAMGDLPE